MEAAIQRNGQWWKRNPAGKWFCWNASTEMWEDAPTGAPPLGPPPPPPAPAPSVVTPRPEPMAYAGPQEGSAAWKAEQIATGQMRIETSPAPQLPETAGTVAPSNRYSGLLTAGSVLKSIRRVRLVVAIVVALSGFFGGSWALGGDAPSSEDLASAFAPIPGYEYTLQSEATRAHLQGLFDSNEILKQQFSGWDSRDITQMGSPVAEAMVVGVDPDSAAAGQLQNTSTMLGADAGVTVVNTTVNGTEALEVTGSTRSVIVFYDDDGMYMIVAGSDLTTLRDVAGKLAAAND